MLHDMYNPEELCNLKIWNIVKEFQHCREFDLVWNEYWIWMTFNYWHWNIRRNLKSEIQSSISSLVFLICIYIGIVVGLLDPFGVFIVKFFNKLAKNKKFSILPTDSPRHFLRPESEFVVTVFEECSKLKWLLKVLTCTKCEIPPIVFHWCSSLI